MLRIPRVLLSMLLLVPALHPCIAQDVAAFIDPYDDLFVFDRGEFVRVDGQKPKEFGCNGNAVGYVAFNGDVKVWQDGRTTLMDRNEGMRPTVTGHYITTNNKGLLKVWDGQEVKVVSGAADAVIIRDSVIAYLDGINTLLNVYWNGRTIQLEDALNGQTLDGWKGSANTLAWVSPSEKALKVFYQGDVFTLNDYEQNAEFKTGLDMVAYRDESDLSFKIFHQGVIHDVETFMPTRYETGMGLCAYVDQGGALKVWDKGKVYTAMEFTPESFQVMDSLVVIKDRGNMQVFRNGHMETLARYWPDTWSAAWGTLAWLDNTGNIQVWRAGRTYPMQRSEAVQDLKVINGLVLARMGSTTRVWWHGQVYSY